MWPAWELGLAEAPQGLMVKPTFRATVLTIPSHSLNVFNTWLSLPVNSHHFHGFQCQCLSVILNCIGPNTSTIMNIYVLYSLYYFEIKFIHII